MTGERFGKLTVIGPPIPHKDRLHSPCRCDCGAETLVRSTYLRTGHTTSCGCHKRSRIVKVTHGHTPRTGHSSVYRRWGAMIQRTTNPDNKQWADYGGRGITVEDPRWLSFEAFYADMGDPPLGKTLDRIDNDRGYCKENCRWVTPKVQRANRRR